MKTLIIVIHPDIENSVVNKRWIKELNKFPEKYTVHQLYKAYPDQKIDVTAEQKLIEEYAQIVFQFPYFWFNCPAFFKQWLDEVLTHGWAYGSQSGFKVSGKTIALAISLGVDEQDLLPTGIYKYPLTELTRPFELSFDYVKANYKAPFAYYGIEHNPSEEWVEKSVPRYMDFLNSL